MNRRRVLIGVTGMLGASGLAGCLGGPGGSIPPTDTPEPTPPMEVSFDLLDVSCGSGDNAATVAFEDGSVSVEGTIGGRNTCERAQLASANRNAGTLEVVVEVVDPHTGAVGCAQCLTDIDYAFHASGIGDGVEAVRVIHRSADGEATVSVEER